MTTEEYNKVSEFLYTKVPDTNNNDFLMEGLKVDVIGLVFADKSEIFVGAEEWDYLK